MSDNEDNEEDIEEIINTSSKETGLMLARIDEGTRQIFERIEDLETVAEQADKRSRRNQIILSGVITAATILFSWSLGLLQF